MNYLFWTVLCFLTITWYVVVTLIVSYRGGKDIKSMLKSLKDQDQRNGICLPCEKGVN